MESTLPETSKQQNLTSPSDKALLDGTMEDTQQLNATGDKGGTEFGIPAMESLPEAADANRSLSPKLDGDTAEGSEEAGPSGRGSVEDIGIGASRRLTTIRPKDCAGAVVWAKLAKYPWWPAQVLDPNDPWIPSSNETPRRGAIPVRFFGTYDFAWIENQRAVCPYGHNHAEHSGVSKQQAFLDAMAEAEHFQATQELPNGFNEDSDPSPQKAPRKVKGGRGKNKKGEAIPPAGKTKKRGNADDTTTKQRSVRERQDGILQALALAPPPESPFSHQPCLDGVKKLLEMQKAGQWPVAPPKPQPLLQQPTYLQYHGVQIPQPQQTQQGAPSQQFQAQQQHQQFQLQQQQFQQQVQQQLQQHASQPNQNPWYMQPSFSAQAGIHLFGQHGGVPGALLAAANQQQFATGTQFAVDANQHARQ